MLAPVRNLTNRIMQRLPGSVAARLDLIRPHLYSSWGGAFNGQRGRQALVRQLFRSIPFDFVVETGSFRGVTTEFLQSVSGLPVYSVEYLSRYFLFSKTRCAYNDLIDITHGDSRTFPPTAIRHIERQNDVCLFSTPIGTMTFHAMKN